MRRTIVTVVAAALILTAATAVGLGLAACGDSSDSTETTQGAGLDAAGRPPDMSAVISEALDPLVEDGTITGDQKSAVVQALASFAPGGAPGGMNQGGQMPSPGATPPGGETPTDGATPPGGGQQGSRPDPSEMFSSSLDTLVEDGTITAEQETAIARALNSAMQQGGPGAQSSPGAVSGQTT